MSRWAACWFLTGVTAFSVAGAAYQPEQSTPAAPALPGPVGGIGAAVQQPVPVPLPPPFPNEPNFPRQPMPRPIKPSAPTLGGPLKLDQFGDPLPAGAVARLGTVRLRHGASPTGLVFTPDGKMLASVANLDEGVRLWDPVSGKELHRLESSVHFAAFALDGTAVILDQLDRCKVWLPLTKVVRELPEKSLPENTTILAMHPSGRFFAAATQKRIAIIDIQTGKTTAEYKIASDQPPIRLVYSPDGKWLAATGPKTGVWLWETKTGKRIRTYPVPTDFCEIAFSPNSDRIAIAAEVLRVYSTDSEESDDGYNPPEGQMINVQFSPDGKWVFGQFPDGTVVKIDPATGAEKEKWEAPEPGLRAPLALSPNGTRTAAIDPSGGIRIWETKTGKGPELERLPLLFEPSISADGKFAACVDMANRIRTFDPTTGKPIKIQELPFEESVVVTYNPRSGLAAAVIPGEESEIQIYDLAKDKIVCKLPGSNTSIPTVTFHPSDRDKVAILSGASVNIYSLATSKAVRSFSVPTQEGADVHGSFSPDGRLIAVSSNPLTVWEVSTGKKRFEIDTISSPLGSVFSPDGRFLAAWDGADKVVVFDVRTGTTIRRFQLPGADGFVGNAIFTPDSKRLITGNNEGYILFWDVATGDATLMLERHDGMVTGLAISPDGKRLISTAADGTALVWDLTLVPQPKVSTPVGGAEEAFRLLAATDPAQAQRGMEYLYRKPDDAVKLLAERIPVPQGTSADRIAAMVADLGSDDFQTRQRAARDLEAVGPEAIEAVQRAVTQSSSPEVKKLATQVLAKLSGPPVQPDELRALRAVEVLEVIHTPAARDLLARWAAGPKGHRLTTEAAAALARLGNAK